MGAVLKFTGGLRAGNYNSSWPFATLTLTPDRMTLQGGGRVWVFAKYEIVRLTKHRGWLSVGLRIQHDKPELPEFLVFWVTCLPFGNGFEKFSEQARSLGYTVD